MKKTFDIYARCRAGTRRVPSHIIRMRLVLLFAFFVSPAMAADNACIRQVVDKTDYLVCQFEPAKHDLRLFLNDTNGDPFGHFNVLAESLARKGEKLVFGMNAGMYHQDRSPVGQYVEGGETLKPLNTNDGPGNFHMKPNGVFWIKGDRAGVTTDGKEGADYATQSGPMLVIDNEIHPRFLPKSTSLKRRNGVGVTPGGTVIFVLADTPVRFYDFALFFRDVLKTPNALYLDGTISRLYAPALGRNDPGAAMGPIIGVVAPNAEGGQ
ncbi:phosphodiester glycosidase family protein [Hyphococcus sp. DH-69]|uniref:phosphodiester glycosidase family protein n=1 Tax=Hyphococcus formosus TaxID=3143534 RepID=UPI00398ADCB8